ncbi:MAG TPA: hypothetical protein VF103_15755, partial [Polyangiaceae bacterium]
MDVSAHTPAEAQPAEAAPPESWRGRVRAALETWSKNLAAYFTEHDPTFRYAVLPAIVVASLLYVRSPFSNYIFDEQE